MFCFQTGQFQLLEQGSMTPSSMIMYQVQTEGAPIAAADISASTNCLAFGDTAGKIVYIVPTWCLRSGKVLKFYLWFSRSGKVLEFQNWVWENLRISGGMLKVEHCSKYNCCSFCNLNTSSQNKADLWMLILFAICRQMTTWGLEKWQLES